MSDQNVYPFILSIRTKNLGSGWKDWKQLAFKSKIAAEIRFYKVAQDYFRAYNYADELEALIETLPDRKLVDTLSAKKEDFA